MVQDKGKLVHSHPANELTEKQFGIESVINKTKVADADAATFLLNSDDVPAGKIWKITHLFAINEDGDIATYFKFSVFSNSTESNIYFKMGATALLVGIDKHVELYLDADDYIRATFSGVGIGETCQLNIFGYEMNAP